MKENPERIEERRVIERMLRSRNRSCCTGAASELIVCADLLRKGWDVFRSVSPACPCDLIAKKGPCLLEIEVRTAQKPTGPFLADKSGQHDILAIVRNFEIFYAPPLPLVET